MDKKTIVIDAQQVLYLYQKWSNIKIGGIVKMIESKPMKRFDSKIENLQAGEMCGHELTWVSPTRKDYEEVVASNIRDGIGTGIKVISPSEQEHVALLVDFDYNENGKMTRFIFVYYDKIRKREYTVDTNFVFGWTVFYENVSYKL
jgi:hypothetical protein